MITKIKLKEWESKEIQYELSENQRKILEVLSSNRIVEFIEKKKSIIIKANSYVGRFNVEDLEITIEPKLQGLELYNLLRYTYGIKELKLINEGDFSLENFQIFDLIIYELYREVEEILKRGIGKSYIKLEEDLHSPKGRIDINKLAKRGGIIKETLPSKYFNREENNLLNQVMIAGLKLSLDLVKDEMLKIKVRRLYNELKVFISEVTLNEAFIRRADREVSRLTENYKSFLKIIKLLYNSQGIELKEGNEKIKLKGHVFDMNFFFENLVGKLLEDFVEDYEVESQYSLKNLFKYKKGKNPRNKRAPISRPDFALKKDGEVIKFLDAKYRNLWEKSLPREMLYQLSIYAISGVGNGTSVIIYPALSDEPKEQEIEITNPITEEKLGSVLLKPINLIGISKFIKDHN